MADWRCSEDEKCGDVVCSPFLQSRLLAGSVPLHSDVEGTMRTGEKLGHYEITALIGHGGMGEVYKASDPRLNRDVAIKSSQEQFSERFEREANAIAALNHPNICTLYDVGPNYLVMEFVEGQTLSDRIKEGPISLEESLKLAHQIA